MATGNKPSEAVLEPRAVPWWISKTKLGIKSSKKFVKVKKPPSALLPRQRDPYWYPPPDQTVTVAGVKVPRKKKRDSLSVLNALASTVNMVNC